MAVVVVVSVLFIFGAVHGNHGERTTDSGLRGLDFYPGRRVRQDPGFLRREEENEARTGPNRGHSVLPVFIPVRYNLRRNDGLERRTEDESISPRLVMDEDFNIQFDNPYIMPLTKPLAFILNSGVHEQDSRSEDDEKVMVPFPVLVEARDGAGGCRDDVLEHRSNPDDVDDDVGDTQDYPKSETPPLYHKEIIPIFRYIKNGTTTFHRTNDRNMIYPRGNNYREPLYYKDNIPPERNHGYNTSHSSREHHHVDAYPGKIFADMYRTIPKHALGSEESHESDYYYDKRRHAGKTKLKGKQNRTYSFRGQAFSASNDLHWVTDGNFTNVKNNTNDDLKNFVIFDSTKLPEPYFFRENAFSASNDLKWVTEGNFTNKKNNITNEKLKSFGIFDSIKLPESFPFREHASSESNDVPWVTEGNFTNKNNNKSGEDFKSFAIVDSTKPPEPIPFREQVFSGSKDIHWVTEGNFTNKKNKTNEDLKSFVIYDAEEPPMTTSTTPTSTSWPETDDEGWGMKILKNVK